MTEIRPGANQSVAKALQIIEVLAESKSPMRLKDIAEALRMPASTVLRMIMTIEDFGYIHQDSESAKYSLTLKLAKLGNAVVSNHSILEAVRPYLQKLSAEFRECVCVAIPIDMEIVYLDAVDSPEGMLKPLQRIGKRAPMHCTGVGKILLLNYSEQQIDELVAKRGLTSFTVNTITTKEGLKAELDRVRRDGYALDDEECELGVKCVAAGIRDYTDSYIAGISITCLASRMTKSFVAEVSNRLMEMANMISASLAAPEHL